MSHAIWAILIALLVLIMSRAFLQELLAQAPAMVTGFVVWTGLVGVDAPGSGTITKTDPTTTWASGQAHSSVTYPLGSNYSLTFTADSESNHYMGCGLGSVSVLSEGLAEMRFGLFAYDANVYIVEDGGFTLIEPYVAGRELKIVKTGSQIEYFYDGHSIGVSGNTIDFAAYVLGTIFTEGNSIYNASINSV